ncbi:DM13 domain-containing protein [Ahrensia sp. R2A130]|uniref:DM13 domain-containing protein n=1 Tax=Ahrensia sp. R2A130 TaxID=744979 RepID=UPI0001E0F056|nr:DM13 domain-containing protein [Ahrensia sp. R2A130]EFL90972.1 secreted protein [Ahrensia sp. R2A130]
MNRPLTTAAAAILALATAVSFAPAWAKDGAGRFSSHKNYKVSGTAKVKGKKLTLSGFRTSSGPDLYVYVGKGSASKRVAKLKANSGTQTYTLPAGNWTSVHIHCKRFSSTFGSASIK